MCNQRLKKKEKINYLFYFIVYIYFVNNSSTLLILSTLLPLVLSLLSVLEFLNLTLIL